MDNVFHINLHSFDVLYLGDLIVLNFLKYLMGEEYRQHILKVILIIVLFLFSYEYPCRNLIWNLPAYQGGYEWNILRQRRRNRHLSHSYRIGLNFQWISFCRKMKWTFALEIQLNFIFLIIPTRRLRSLVPVLSLISL